MISSVYDHVLIKVGFKGKGKVDPVHCREGLRRNRSIAALVHCFYVDVSVAVKWKSVTKRKCLCPNVRLEAVTYICRGIGRGRGNPLARPMGVARCHPGRFEQLAFHNDDTYAAEDFGYFSSYMPGIYDETNRY
jgi:hypothetical protein